MSSTSFKASCILKGCNAKFINNLVSSSNRGEDIKHDIIIKSLSVVNSYDINECKKIINNHGDFHDAYSRMVAIPGNKIESANKVRFYRQFAFIYVRQIISMKVKVKIDAIKLKKKIASETSEISCPICLEKIEDKSQFTQCNHLFHRECMTQWGKNICPVCRGNV
jgi:hypothetical protein